MGAHGALGSVFRGICSAQASVMFRGLWCSGVCAVWGLHFLGFAVLEGLSCSRVCVPRRSVLLQALDFVSSPHPFLAIPAPFFLLQSLSPSPPAPPAPLSFLQTLPTIPAMSPALILDPSSPCSSRTCCSQPSVSRFPPRAPAPPPFPPVLPLPGICPSCPHGRGQDSVHGDAATAASAPARGDKDANPRAGRSPARISRWNEGGNRDRTGGLVAPAWFVVPVL